MVYSEEDERGEDSACSRGRQEKVHKSLDAGEKSDTLVPPHRIRKKTLWGEQKRFFDK
jgi:hypothetical protein